MARPQPQPTKSKAHKASDELQVERLHKGYAQSMEITKVLADEQSQFQHIRIFDTVANGRVMTLDDIVQITSRDESAYADMLTHLPMLEHGKVERVMIVGKAVIFQSPTRPSRTRTSKRSFWLILTAGLSSSAGNCSARSTPRPSATGAW